MSVVTIHWTDTGGRWHRTELHGHLAQWIPAEQGAVVHEVLVTDEPLQVLLFPPPRWVRTDMSTLRPDRTS